MRRCIRRRSRVLRTRAEPLGWNLIVGDPLTDLDYAEVFGGLLQYPGTSGAVRDLRPAIAALRAKGALAVVAADLLALTLIASPGELGADIAIGSAQRFGVPMGYGGPHAAYMSVRDALKRSLPGRIVGLSVDSRGQPAYRLALQTREQHIRREKATSNICTAQVLLAVIASMYAVYHGPEGLTHIARTVHRRAVVLAAGLAKLGFAPTVAGVLRYGHGCRPARSRTRSSPARSPKRSICGSVTARSALRSTRPPRLPSSRRCGAPSAASFPMRMSRSARAKRFPPN